MTEPQPSGPRKVVAPRGGLLHVLDASRYSMAGLARLMQETAARLEVVAGLLVALAFAWHGAALWQWLGVLMLLALVLAFEALNTAIEVLTDRVSPEWSQMAKDAKDLGSLAVGLLLAVLATFVALVLTGVI